MQSALRAWKRAFLFQQPDPATPAAPTPDELFKSQKDVFASVAKQSRRSHPRRKSRLPCPPLLAMTAGGFLQVHHSCKLFRRNDAHESQATAWPVTGALL